MLLNHGACATDEPLSLLIVPLSLEQKGKRKIVGIFSRRGEEVEVSVDDVGSAIGSRDES